MLIQRAIEQLYNQCRETGHCDLLLDPQAGSPFGEQIAVLDAQYAPRLHLRDPMFVESPLEAPMLLRLPLTELPLLEAMAIHAQREALDTGNRTRSVCGFLQCAEPQQRMASRLSSALSLRVERQALYFRFFDPRVFHHLPHLLSADTLAQLLQGISSWSYFLWDGCLATHEAPEPDRMQPVQLDLTSEQWHRFDTIEHFNAAQRLFGEEGMRFEPEQTAQLFAEVHAARATGLQAPEDTAYYLACNRSLKTPLQQDEAWPKVLMMLNHDVPLADALAQLCGIHLPAAPATKPAHLAQTTSF